MSIPGNITAVISMIHEPIAPNSASRCFRSEPVLDWTLRRLCMSDKLGSIAVICWEDQLQDVAPVAAEHEAHILAKGPRVTLGSIQAIAASRRWSDGWRGGPQFTCDFDLGFHGPWVRQVVEKLKSDAVVLVDPSAGLVDPRLIDRLIEHARDHEELEMVFTQAAPGLAGVLLRTPLIERLAAAGTHPGRLLHYLPDQPMRDPIGGQGCVPVPLAVARTTRGFRLDSDRQIKRLTEASINLNGELVASDADQLLNRLVWTAKVDSLPREIVVEINSTRATRPIFLPGPQCGIDRPPMRLDMASRIFEQIAAADDARVTLAGAGDPLLHDEVFAILESARASGVRAIHVQTDLLPPSGDAAARLAESGIDIVSVNLPATSCPTYAKIMGIDRLMDVIENIRRFVTRRHESGAGVPLLVPLFAKCANNIAEVEAWYDQWLKALGCAVIVGPGDFCGLIDDCAVADMSPPRRKPCARLWSRMMILSDGRVVSCEQDLAGKQVVGDAARQSLRDIWEQGMSPLRKAHKEGSWGACELCPGCREWHRP